ncbi:MAG: ABC transporter permease [Bacillati bacterium ANGP1]|uniref:ABC transporter permease n=1 Tax=Candidatus Segetimicrobium genomatis TaxID=2569760 RepID=A0A537J8C1_9BACT|nr:MAG: ABC transporter permease [Terrabacteria group bacterium ANGP1]
MGRYVLVRVVLAVPTLVGLTVVTFFVSHLLPADMVLVNLGDQAVRSPELVAAFKHRWGLDRPLLVQYLVYAGNLLRGNLGTSIATHRPVLAELALSLPATMELASMALVAAVAIGVLLGVLAAVRRNSLVDVTARGVSSIGVAIPTFWFAILLLALVYFRLGWAPPPGRLSAGVAPPEPITGMYLVDSLLHGQIDVFIDAFRHVVLPGIVIATVCLGYVTRITRASMIEVLLEDYVRTACAKGLTAWAVIVRHALRNSLIPVITIGGTLYAQVMSGTVMAETIYSWPGIGRYAFTSAGSMDFPAVMGVALVVGIVYVAVDLCVDVLYVWVNPRVRYA